MKSLIHFAMIIFLMTINVFPQWKFINPDPIVDKSFLIYSDSLTCEVLTESGTVVSSYDAGENWSYYYSDLPTFIFDSFFNDEIGWAVGGGKACKTTDRGRTWEDKGNVLQYTTADIYFSDSQHGWAVGNSYIKSTSDGGDTWNTTQLCGQLQFISQYNDTIFFTASYDTLYRSTDSGNTWHTLPKRPDWSFEKFTALRTDSTTYGFLLYDGIIDVTSDGGNTWDTVFPNYNYVGISALTGHERMLLGISNTRIFRSTDYGNSWDTVYIPVGNYSKVSFGSDQIIYMSSPEGKLIKSSDGGLSFNSIINNQITGNVNYVTTVDSQCVYLTTVNPQNIYNSLDAGETFTRITPVNFPDTENKITAVSRDMAAAIADIKIYTTKNAGQNWSVSSYGPPATYAPLDIYFRDTLNGMVSCGWDLMRETSNGGETWINRFLVPDTAQTHLLSLSFPDPENGYLSSGDRLYKTTNGGTDWVFHTSMNPQIFRVKFTDLQNGIGKTNEHLYSTSDGGMSWSVRDSVNPCYDFDIMKNGSGSVLMALDYAYVYTSTDLGSTFTKEKLPFTGFTNLRMIDPANAWISGYNGKMIKYHDDDIITHIKNNDNNITEFSLLQNYPNPFNPNTTIKYSIPENSFVKLKIYDILGREIATLVDSKNAAGIYNVEFNAGNIASGVYFYKIEIITIGSNKHFAKVNKMILLK